MILSLDKKISYRELRISSLIHKVLMDILNKGKILDIRFIKCPIIITRVVVKSDFKLADCYFLPFNTDLSVLDIIDILNTSKYFIRRLVTSKINLKYSISLRFYYDNGFNNFNNVVFLLKK